MNLGTARNIRQFEEELRDLAYNFNVLYADRAGNCWLCSLHDHLLLERQGFRTERQSTPAAANPFSTKSTRIVRALLCRPTKGWRVRELADHPEVQVSAGLVVKVSHGDTVQEVSLQKYRGKPVTIGGKSFEIAYSSKTVPLGFTA